MDFWWIGDLPTWLSLLLAAGIAIAGFVNRNRIGGWIGRLLLRTPPSPVEPAWELRRIDNTRFVFANNGTGVPRSVKIEPDQGDVYLTSKHGWDAFPPGQEEEIEMQQAVSPANLDATISWHVEDRNTTTGWRRESQHVQLPLNREY